MVEGEEGSCKMEINAKYLSNLILNTRKQFISISAAKVWSACDFVQVHGALYVSGADLKMVGNQLDLFACLAVEN